MGPSEHDREIAIELAAYICENADEIAREYIEWYDRTYTHSRGSAMSEDMRQGWIRSVIELFAAEIEGDVDSAAYLTCGGDMVIQCEKALNPIAVYVESTLALARFIAPRAWRLFADNPAKVKRAFAVLEACAQERVRANVNTFLDQMGRPGSLSSTWDFYSAQPGVAAPAPANPPARSSDVRGLALTPREEEVVALVVDGLSNKEIAARLGTSLSTVKNHLGRIFDKLGVQSRTELVARALHGAAD